MSFGSLGAEDDAPMAEINVTPLVDVMLVLLIVFMITMPILTHSIPLQLPTSNTTKDVEPPKDPVRLAIDKEGQYYFGAESAAPLNIEEVEKTLSQALIDNDKLVLAISADKSVKYEYVARALGLARELGIAKIGFVTQDPASEKAPVVGAK